MRTARLLLALCFVFCAATAARAESAGQVMFAHGDALALRDGRIIPLVSGSPVESGDQIHTGADSYVQIRFTDWSVISLRPRTDFVVEDYAYEARTGGREKAFFNLLRGGMRSLTGLIGHRDRANYRMRTPTSTIGIRGTHYSVLICRQDCRLADGGLGDDGLYGGVIDGRIAVTPYGGGALEREFGAGEYFRLENENSVPAPVFIPPTFFWDRHEPQARTGGRTFAGVPWKPVPVAIPTSDQQGVAGADLSATAGALLRTDGSLTLSPITAPVLSQAGTLLSATTSTVASPIAPLSALAGSTVTALSPTVAPITSALGSAVAPLAPVIAPVLAPVAPVVAPIIAPIAPVVAPIAPIVPVAPVVSPPPALISLPTVPTLPVTSGLPSLLPKK